MKTKLLTSGILAVLLFGYFLSRESAEPYTYTGEKVKGLSFVAPREPIDVPHFQETFRVNANWVALMPYAFVGNGNPELQFLREGQEAKGGHQWWGEQPDGLKECIELARKSELNIMLKPHIWCGRGTYTGDFTLASEEEWRAFETTYAEYILQYAKIAEVFKVEVFCLATEMETMVAERPEFWQALIKEVKKVYSGKLTYAENWDCFEEVPFWDQLDFVGIDGYFPLSKEQSPELATLRKGWKKHLRAMEKVSAEVQKPILFTEYGYRSCDYSTEKPWDTDYSLPDNEGLQARAYESLYQEVWQKPWFAGGFVWKWFPNKKADKASRDKFCPQHKLAEETIKSYYGQSIVSKL